MLIKRWHQLHVIIYPLFILLPQYLSQLPFLLPSLPSPEYAPPPGLGGHKTDYNHVVYKRWRGPHQPPHFRISICFVPVTDSDKYIPPSQLLRFVIAAAAIDDDRLSQPIQCSFCYFMRTVPSHLSFLWETPPPSYLNPTLDRPP